MPLYYREIESVSH